jgi:hypothetical protein
MSETSRQEENPEEKIEIEKPAILYHASQNREIEEFEPHKETYRDPNEGPVIFATPDKAYASCFLVPKATDSWCQKSIFTNPEDGKSIYVMIISDKDRYIKSDRCGAIYSLPNDTFETDLTKSMKSREWTSRETVKPNGKTEYESGLEAMLENKVQVYFTDRETFNKIRKSDDHGFSIIQTLKPENNYDNK